MEIITVFGVLHRWKIFCKDKTIILAKDSLCLSPREGWFQLQKSNGKYHLIRCVFVDRSEIFNPEAD
jgi:hypothetical protein